MYWIYITSIILRYIYLIKIWWNYVMISIFMLSVIIILKEFVLMGSEGKSL